MADVQRSVDFYAHLGFRATATHEPEGWLLWAALESGGARLMVTLATDPVHQHEQAILLYLYAADLDGLRAGLLGAGLRPGPIENGAPGPERELRMDDPDGYTLIVAETETGRVRFG